MNLNDITLKELRKIGKELKVKGFSTMRKPGMMAAISDAMEDEEVAETVETMIAQIEPTIPRGQVKPSAGVKEVTFEGRTQSIAAWADELGLKRPALYDRINRQGWSVEEALTIPANGRRKRTEIEGQIKIEEY